MQDWGNIVRSHLEITSEAYEEEPTLDTIFLVMLVGV